MKTKYFFTSLIVLVSALIPTQSLKAADFFVYAEGGRGSSRLSSDYSIDGTNTSVNNTMLTSGVGLVFESHFLAGVESTAMNTDSFFGATDRYDINQIKFYGGYRIDLASNFRITPILGINRWQLRSKTGAVFIAPNPKVGTHRGDAIYGQLNVEFPLSDLLTIITSINQTSFDFGTTKSVQAGLLFQF